MHLNNAPLCPLGKFRQDIIASNRVTAFFYRFWASNQVTYHLVYSKVFSYQLPASLNLCFSPDLKTHLVMILADFVHIDQKMIDVKKDCKNHAFLY